MIRISNPETPIVATVGSSAATDPSTTTTNSTTNQNINKPTIPIPGFRNRFTPQRRRVGAAKPDYISLFVNLRKPTQSSAKGLHLIHGHVPKIRLGQRPSNLPGYESLEWCNHELKRGVEALLRIIVLKRALRASQIYVHTTLAQEWLNVASGDPPGRAQRESRRHWRCPRLGSTIKREMSIMKIVRHPHIASLHQVLGGQGYDGAAADILYALMAGHLPLS
ncbi:hypothetical protein SDJN03_16461, partial [Cucurbita argyrosperma subsp. sororia]